MKKSIGIISLFIVCVAISISGLLTRANGLEIAEHESFSQSAQQETQDNITLKSFSTMLDGKSDEEIDDFFTERGTPDYATVIAEKPGGYTVNMDYGDEGFTQITYKNGETETYYFSDPTVSATVGEVKEYVKSLN